MSHGVQEGLRGGGAPRTHTQTDKTRWHIGSHVSPQARHRAETTKKSRLLRPSVAGGSHWLSFPIAEAKKRTQVAGLGRSHPSFQCQTWSVAKYEAIKQNGTEADGSQLSARKPLADATFCPSLDSEAVRVHITCFSQVGEEEWHKS